MHCEQYFDPECGRMISVFFLCANSLFLIPPRSKSVWVRTVVNLVFLFYFLPLKGAQGLDFPGLCLICLHTESVNKQNCPLVVCGG